MKNKLVKKLVVLGLVTAMTVTTVACGAPKETDTTTGTEVVEVESQGETLSEADLSNAPVYGANPEYALFTTVLYEVVDAGQQFVATISANEELTEFEIICNFFEDQKAVVEKQGEELAITYDRSGFMAAFGTEIVSMALEQDVWVPTTACTLAYVDPAAHDNDPLYLRTGIYEDDFQRANDNLNNLLTDVADETLAAYKEPCEEKGTVVPVEYDTYFYGKDGVDGDVDSHATPIKKTAYVYLPANYDEGTQYNVLYLLHGGGDTATKWFSQCDDEETEIGEGYAVNILDNMFANGDAEPCIVVTPGMYDAEGFEEVEGAQDYVSNYFDRELRDLIQVVESEYTTYAADTTEQGLIDSRDHRAMAGLSMGSITTWCSGIDKALDIFSWYGNMSAGPSADETAAVNYIKDEIIPALEEGNEQGYNVNMMLSFNGANDMALNPHVAAHKELVAFSENSDILTVGENYDFVASNGTHAFTAWNLYLYDLMKVFFK